jgi:hypothetical protein
MVDGRAPRGDGSRRRNPPAAALRDFWSPTLNVIAMPRVRLKRRPACSDELRHLFPPPPAVPRGDGPSSSLSRPPEVHCLPLVLV